MRHGYRKIKFKQGKDANKMLLRKLAINFLAHGKINTTYKRAKTLKTWIEKIVEKSKQETQANKNYLLKILTNKKTIKFLFSQVGPLLRDKTGGYVRVVKLQERLSDGSLICRLDWVYPVVVKEVEAVKKNS